jgi:WD40 repeat protein
MLINQLHWLEVAEYLSIVLTLIGLIVAIASGGLLYPIIFLSIAGVFNLINRLRFQHRSRKRLAGAIKQLHYEFSEEIQALATAKGEMTPSPHAPSETNPIETTLQANLAGLEESLDQVIQYLNHYALADRVEILEQSCTQLQQAMSRLSKLLTNSEEISLPKIERPSTESQPPLESVALAETLSLPSIPTWTCIQTLTHHPEPIGDLAISPDGKFLASASWDQTLKLWEIATGNLVSTVVGHSQGLLAVVFTGDGHSADRYSLATGSFDQTIKLWSMELKEPEAPILTFRQSLAAHTGSIHALAIAPQHQILVSGSYDRTIKQWNLETGEMLYSSYDQLGAIYAIALDRERQLIASAGGDGRITLWQLGSGEKLGSLSGNISSVESLAISPDGQTLAAGCVDGSVKVWQLPPSNFLSQSDPSPMRIFTAHAGQVKALAFSIDGQTLLSSGADGRIKIWHPQRNDALTILTLADDPTQRLSSVCSLVLSPDGQILAAGGVDGTIKIWQAGTPIQ